MQKHQNFFWEYFPSNNTNHLPMAYLAMKKLGASNSHIEEFQNHYIAKKNLKEFTQEEIENINKINLITSVDLNDIFLGAFHGLIQLAYSYIENDIFSQKSASGYYRYLIQNSPKIEFDYNFQSQNNISIQDFIYFFQEYNLSNKDQLISLTLQDFLLDTSNSVKDYIYNTNINDIEDLLQLAIFVYSHSKKLDFISLHCITGIHAAIVVNNIVKIDNLFQKLKLPILGLLAISLTQINNKLVYELPTKSRTTQLEDCIDRANTSFEDHEIKLVYSISQLSKQFSEINYDIALKNIF